MGLEGGLVLSMIPTARFKGSDWQDSGLYSGNSVDIS